MSKKVIVVGGGLAGVTATYLLTKMKCDVVLIEKSGDLGGYCRSFTLNENSVFDYGLHLMDENRSKLTTFFYKKILKGKVRRFSLKRSLTINNSIVSYNAPLKDWPESLKTYFDSEEFVDNLLNESHGPITREDLNDVYGRRFVDLVFDEVLMSYPWMKYRVEQGADPAILISWVYPWFFPRATKFKIGSGKYNEFHGRVREEVQQTVLYPEEGGFGAYVTGMIDETDRGYLELKSDVSRLDFEIDAKSKSISKITCDDDVYEHPTVLWCAPNGIAMNLFAGKKEKYPLQKLVLGSFVFDKEIATDHDEILVGSLQHPINRLSFPGLINGSGHPQIQVEFMYPIELFDDDEEAWRRRWLKSFCELGLISESHQVLDFDFHIKVLPLLTHEQEHGQTQAFLDATVHPESNVTYFSDIMGHGNISRDTPALFQKVAKLLDLDTNELIETILGEEFSEE